MPADPPASRRTKLPGGPHPHRSPQAGKPGRHVGVEVQRGLGGRRPRAARTFPMPMVTGFHELGFAVGLDGPDGARAPAGARTPPRRFACPRVVEAQQNPRPLPAGRPSFVRGARTLNRDGCGPLGKSPAARRPEPRVRAPPSQPVASSRSGRSRHTITSRAGKSVPSEGTGLRPRPPAPLVHAEECRNAEFAPTRRRPGRLESSGSPKRTPRSTVPSFQEVIDRQLVELLAENVHLQPEPQCPAARRKTLHCARPESFDRPPGPPSERVEQGPPRPQNQQQRGFAPAGRASRHAQASSKEGGSSTTDERQANAMAASRRRALRRAALVTAPSGSISFGHPAAGRDQRPTGTDRTILLLLGPGGAGGLRPAALLTLVVGAKHVLRTAPPVPMQSKNQAPRARSRV